MAVMHWQHKKKVNRNFWGLDLAYLPREFQADLGSVFLFASMDIRVVGAEFQDRLKEHLKEDPHLFDNYTTRDIAETLKACRRSWRGKSDQELLLKIYKPFSVRNDHLIRANDLDKRIELIKALMDSALLEDKPSLDRLTRLNDLNNLHAHIFGFVPEKVTVETRKPVLTDGFWVLGNGGRDIATRTIALNDYQSDDPGITMVARFYKNWADISCLVLHEGRHSYQDYMGRNALSIEEPELRDWASVMYFSTEGNYYIRGKDEVNLLNPSETDAYDFENDMKKFYAASPEARKSIIIGMEMRRDAHLQMLAPAVAQPQPQPALIAA